MTSLGICVLGLGRAGSFHLQSLQATCKADVRAVYDVDGDRCQQVAATHACAAAASAAEAIDRDDVDAVIVATPTDNHFPFVKLALEAGKPVLTEKPLGSTLTQVDDSFGAAVAAGVPLFVAFQRRFDPSFSTLIRRVRQGDVGTLQFVRSVSRDNPVPAPEYIAISGGIFHDCMVHDLDMVVQIVQETPKYLSAFGSSFLPEIGRLNDFDNVVATLHFESGVSASIDINRNSVYGYDQRLEAFGDGGMVTADNWHETSVTTASAAGFARPPIDFSFPTRYRQAYLAELEAFVDCARGEREVPISHQDVRINHLLASGLEAAARERRVVAFAEIEGTIEAA